MKFYKGLVDVGKSPVQNQIQRGFVPMTINSNRKQVQVAGARPTNPMSAAEVVLLRNIHGIESVTGLEEIGEKKQMSFADARNRLEETYGEAMVEKVFGVAGSALPREVHEIAPEPEGEAEQSTVHRAYTGSQDVDFDVPPEAEPGASRATLTLKTGA